MNKASFAVTIQITSTLKSDKLQTSTALDILTVYTGDRSREPCNDYFQIDITQHSPRQKSQQTIQPLETRARICESKFPYNSATVEMKQFFGIAYVHFGTEYHPTSDLRRATGDRWNIRTDANDFEKHYTVREEKNNNNARENPYKR